MGVSGFTALALAGLLLVNQVGATERPSGSTAAPKDVPKPRLMPLTEPAPKPQPGPWHGPPPKPTPLSWDQR